MNASKTCLQLDVGNSSAKWRLCQGTHIGARGNYLQGDKNSLQALLNCTDSLDYIWISSVAGPETERALAQQLQQRWHVEPWFAQTQASSGSLSNSYADPGRMGVDRWLAMLAVRARCTEKFCVIDGGSALTIDIVDAQGQHEGGYIIPGPALMERALLLDTDRVRFAEVVDYALAPGTSTAAAVRHGIALAQAGAVKLALDQCEGPVALYFCGGGGEKLMQLLGGAGLWVPDLVFEGLEAMAELSDTSGCL